MQGQGAWVVQEQVQGLTVEHMIPPVRFRRDSRASKSDNTRSIRWHGFKMPAGSDLLYKIVLS